WLASCESHASGPRPAAARSWLMAFTTSPVTPPPEPPGGAQAAAARASATTATSGAVIRHRRARRPSGGVSTPGAPGAEDTDEDDGETGSDMAERVMDPIPLSIQGVSTPRQLAPFAAQGSRPSATTPTTDRGHLAARRRRGRR